MLEKTGKKDEKYQSIKENNLDNYLEREKSISFMKKSFFDMGDRGITIMKNNYEVDVDDHIHDFYSIQYVESGESVQYINKEKVVLKEGTICIFSRNTSHYICKTDENTRIFHIGLDEKIFDSLFLKNIGLRKNIISNFIYNSINIDKKSSDYLMIEDLSDDIKDIMNLVYYEYRIRKEGYESMIFSYLIILMNKLNRHHLDRNKDKNKYSNSKNEILMSRLLDYIEKNSENINLMMASDYLHLHPNYLSSLVKKIVGVSFTKMVQDVRLEKAANMLIMTDESIYNISKIIGYENTNYFYKLFKSKYHMTPKEFRLNEKKSL